MRFEGEGQPQGLPLRGVDVVVVVERVRQFGRAVPEPPLRCKLGDGDDGEGCGGWIPASAGKMDVWAGGSRTAPTGRVGWEWMMGRGMGSRPRLHGGRLFERATEEGMGPRIREDNGRGMGPRPPVFTGAGSRREDNGRGVRRSSRWRRRRVFRLRCGRGSSL